MLEITASGRLGQVPVYTPAYNDGSKDIPQKLRFSVASNEPFSNRGPDFINITLWGATADAFAKMLHQGKGVTIQGSLRQHEQRIIRNGQFIVDNTGVPITVKQLAIERVNKLEMHNDASKIITEEINRFKNGEQDVFRIRPQFWNVPGTQDAQIWKQIVDARMKTQFNPQSATFGYADVQMPQSGRMIAPFKSRRERSQGLEQQVANAVNNQPQYQQPQDWPQQPQNPVQYKNWPQQPQNPVPNMGQTPPVRPQYGQQPQQQQTMAVNY
jgi:single-stranded DNA-binding protein